MYGLTIQTSTRENTERVMSSFPPFACGNIITFMPKNMQWEATNVICRIKVRQSVIDDNNEYEVDFDLDIDTISYSVYDYFKVGNQNHSRCNKYSMRAAVPGIVSDDAIWQVKADQYKQANLRQQKRDKLRQEAWRLPGIMTEDADCDASIASIESVSIVAARVAKELALAELMAEARAVVADQSSVDIAASDSELSKDGTANIAMVDSSAASKKTL